MVGFVMGMQYRDQNINFSLSLLTTGSTELIFTKLSLNNIDSNLDTIPDEISGTPSFFK